MSNLATILVNEVKGKNPNEPEFLQAVTEVAENITPLLEKNNFSLDIDKTISLINKKTSLIILNSPGNPTGGLIKENDLSRVIKFNLKMSNET